MKFVFLLASFCEAKITLNVETLTDFNTAYQMTGTDVPLGVAERVSFSGNAKLSMDLFKGKLSLIESGESTSKADCTTNPYARYDAICRNPVLKSLIGGHGTQDAAGQLFIDATTGQFGLKGGHHFTDSSGATFQDAFCAIVNVPIKSYPPPAALKSKLNAAAFKRMEDRLNSLPHTENDGIATFQGPPDYGKTHGYSYGDRSVEIYADGGAPRKAEVTGYEPDHRPYTNGWQGANETFHVVGSASVTFSEWTSPATELATFTSCPDGTTMNLHAHPEAKRSLASLNVLVQMLRQHDDLVWLPEDPASYFMEQLKQQDLELNAESEGTQRTPLVTSLLAGVVGGGVVLALSNLAKRKQRQVPLLSEA